MQVHRLSLSPSKNFPHQLHNFPSKTKNSLKQAVYAGSWGNVSPTTWTIGHAVPFHTRQIYIEFGLGLGLNTMQGREAKHQAISKYCYNAMSSDRWDMVFRHEYVSMLWLPKHDPSSYKYGATKYIWNPASLEDPTSCSCGQPKNEGANKCWMCECPREVGRRTENLRRSHFSKPTATNDLTCKVYKTISC